jgi:hypothetical protein
VSLKCFTKREILEMQGTRGNRIIVVLMLLMISISCAGNKIATEQPPSLPDHIYRQPLRNYFTGCEVGVFAFGSPIYSPGVGETASGMIYRQLIADEVFRKVTALFHRGTLSFERQMAVAKEQSVDLMICGNVLCYMDGSLTQSGRVDIEVNVFEVATGALIWGATFQEIGAPTVEKDFFLFQTKGKPATPAMGLMKGNIEKIIHLFQSESPAYASLPEDMKWVDKGYQFLLKGDYVKAKGCFEGALRINVDNAHARYNLGVTEELTGHAAAAIEQYEKVIILSPDTIVSQIVVDGRSGLSLVALAQKRLQKIKEQTIE